MSLVLNLIFPQQIFALFINMVFLGQAFTIMLVYVWSRRNPYVSMSFFGLLTFQAPYLPWVLFAFSLLLGNSVIVDILGMHVLCGTLYYMLPWLQVLLLDIFITSWKMFSLISQEDFTS